MRESDLVCFLWSFWPIGFRFITSLRSSSCPVKSAVMEMDCLFWQMGLGRSYRCLNAGLHLLVVNIHPTVTAHTRLADNPDSKQLKYLDDIQRRGHKTIPHDSLVRKRNLPQHKNQRFNFSQALSYREHSLQVYWSVRQSDRQTGHISTDSQTVRQTGHISTDW